MRMKILGFIPITKNQFIIYETILFSFFFLLTVFFFSYNFPEYIDDPLILFHAKYLKYVTLILSFLVVVEAQYYLNIFIGKQLKIIEKQKKKIEFQNDEIKQSIRYAGRIQESILPPKDKLPKDLNYFILYKPKDIVSGDYYWFAEKCNKLIIVAADCTGHGVPGAFMSVLGISSFNEIINETDECLNSGKILNRLRDRIITSLKQKDDDLISEAGMDLALIIYDKENRKVQFSGAKNPLFIIRKHTTEKEGVSNKKQKTILGSYELNHIQPDKMPISKYPIMEPFSVQDINLQKNDTLYIFSDGFADQLGGERGKKLLMKRFKAILLKIQEKSMPEQEKILNDFLNKWKNTNEQTDDIIVFGIKV
ncbi:MAG: serine/threonine-protein phosphatase [Bacteroidales bacterium]|nr:serine/threonine-protein phosphatase [Bacteroidales bacterium]